MPVMGDLFIELGIIAIADFSVAKLPDRLHGVEGLGLDLDLLVRVLLLARLLWRTLIDDGKGDEIGILMDNHRELPAVGIIFNSVFRIRLFEMKNDVRAAA